MVRVKPKEKVEIILGQKEKARPLFRLVRFDLTPVLDESYGIFMYFQWCFHVLSFKILQE